MPYLKFLASTVPEIWTGSQNFKSRSRDAFQTLPVFNYFYSVACTLYNHGRDIDLLILQTVRVQQQ